VTQSGKLEVLLGVPCIEKLCHPLNMVKEIPTGMLNLSGSQLEQKLFNPGKARTSLHHSSKVAAAVDAICSIRLLSPEVKQP
jgi:hypothetical protein